MRPNYGSATGGGGGGVSLVSDFLSEAASTYSASGPNPYALVGHPVAYASSRSLLAHQDLNLLCVGQCTLVMHHALTHARCALAGV